MTFRVLHIHAGTAWGGVESAIETLAGIDAGLEYRAALGWDGSVATRLRRRMRVDILGAAHLSRPWTGRASRRTLGTLVTEVQPDVCLMHSTWAVAVWAAAVRDAAIPLVLWHHGRPPGGLLGYVARRQHVTLHLANSAWTARGVSAAWPGARPPVLHPPAHRAPPASRQITRTRLRVPEHGVVLMTAARWERGKGHDQLVQAVARLDPHLPWVLWLAGGAPTPAARRLEAAARAAVTRAGLDARVRFLGHRDDVGDLLVAADLYVQPNTGPEAFGLSFIEAMAAAVPVVTSDIGAAREVVSPSCGVLVPPGDVATLASTLEALIADEARRANLALAGPSWAHTLTDPMRLAGELAALLHDVAGATLSSP